MLGTDYDIPVVRFSNGVVKQMEYHYWQSEDFPCIVVGQYPLCLAWALTIHKIQGSTLNLAEIDIGNTIFEYGQTYVALSRIKSLDGLYLSAFNPYRIKANPVVKQFYSFVEDSVLDGGGVAVPEVAVEVDGVNRFDKYAYSDVTQGIIAEPTSVFKEDVKQVSLNSGGITDCP